MEDFIYGFMEIIGFLLKTLFGLGVVGFAGLLIFGIYLDFKSFHESKYIIKQYYTRFYTNEYREKDGCIYFIDTKIAKDKEESHLCGGYSVWNKSN